MSTTPRYTEAQCSTAVRALLESSCDDHYSHEVGALGEWADGAFKARAGGTRTTPGFPDLTFYLHDPERITLTVEAKGYATRLRAHQWRFAMYRMQRGDPHLIVRSPEALLTGLRYLGLLSAKLLRAPLDTRALPENFAFLERTRIRMWGRRTPPDYALLYVPQWTLRRRCVQPADVPRLLEEEAVRRAKKFARERAR